MFVFIFSRLTFCQGKSKNQRVSPGAWLTLGANMDGLVLGNFAPLEGETVSVVNGHLAQAEAQVKQERSVS